jgi:N-methylhydantoinase A
MDMIDTTPTRRVGVDTGGTFTDCVYVDGNTNTFKVAKVPSQPSAPNQAVLDGVRSLEVEDSIDTLVHGTTIGTNAVIVGDYATAGLITNRGFRDVLEIGTQQRELLYILNQSPRPSLIPRHLRLEVAGRIGGDGFEVEPVDEDEVREAAQTLVDAGVAAIAICCVFSHVDDRHERRIEEIVREIAPEDTYVIRASRTSHEPREYPRFATGAVNASLAPVIEPYIRKLDAELTANVLDGQLYIMQSSGGIGTVERSVGERVHQLILSGPAAGVIGGAQAAADCGYTDSVTFDVGGTSADIGVVHDGIPRTGFEIKLPNGIPCNLAHIEVETIGAGGGSIGWVDAGGALNSGPQSAGAEPGPACYGRGGTQPTTTDAHLFLGRLSQGGLIDGGLSLDRDRSETALAEMGEQIDMDATEAAIGVLAVLEENMVGAIRRAAARHGDDLRDYVLVAGGGAGPLHAGAAARILNMKAAVIPPRPGLLSALGLLSADLRHDHATVLLGLGARTSLGDIEEAFDRLRDEADEALAADEVEVTARSFDRTLEVRYLGQSSTLQVPHEQGQDLSAVDATFHELHERTFGHSSPDTETEVVSARVIGIGARSMPGLDVNLPTEAGEPFERREVVFTVSDGPVDTPVYRREVLAVDQVIEGPAIIEQMDTTTVLIPEMTATVHPSGNLILTNTGEGTN